MMKKLLVVLGILATSMFFFAGCFEDDSDYGCEEATAEGCDEVQICCSSEDCYYEADGEKIECDGMDCAEALEELADHCSGYECVKSTVGDCDSVQQCCSPEDCYYETDGEKFECDGTDCTEAADELEDYCSDFECVDTPTSGCNSVQTCCSTDECYYEADGQTFQCDGLDCTAAATSLVEYCSGD